MSPVKTRTTWKRLIETLFCTKVTTVGSGEEDRSRLERGSSLLFSLITHWFELICFAVMEVCSRVKRLVSLTLLFTPALFPWPSGYQRLRSLIQTCWSLEEFCIRLEFYKNSPLPGGASLEEVREVCIVYQGFAGTWWLDSHQLRSAEEAQPSLDPCWSPDVFDCQSPLAPPISPSLDIKEAWTRCTFFRWIWGLGLPSSQLASFLTPHSDDLSFGLSQRRARGLWPVTRLVLLIPCRI